MPNSVDVKVSKTVPGGATATGVPAFSDRLSKVAGVKKAALDRAGFKGDVGSTLVLDDGSHSRIIVGLGPSSDTGTSALRRGGAAFARAAGRHRRTGFELPEVDGLDVSDTVRAVAEGVMLGAYSFDEFKPSAASKPSLGTVTIAAGDAVRTARDGVRVATVIADAVCFARDLVNTPGGALTPSVFAEKSAERAAAAGVTAEVWDEQDIRAAGMGGLLAVNQGSAEPPRMVKLTYEPAGTDGSTDTVALVGKGITFDSGGLSIKPAEGMIGMKGDMAGAAAVIAAMCALPALEVPVRVVSYTPMTDNMTGGAAQRPGDVYTAHNGTTVEVLNTDAEGRLVLADALSMASNEKPAAIVDLATLTGACMVALGDRIAGIMSNDDEFRTTLAEKAEQAGERVWPLPLPDDYRARLDSPIADIQNIGGGRYGGALTAGLFLRDFVGEGIPWVHMDIAGPAYLSEPDGEQSKGATGFGVRTLITLLSEWGPDTTA